MTTNYIKNNSYDWIFDPIYVELEIKYRDIATGKAKMLKFR